jgi:transcriptional regulator with XRE-family HTH domain
MLENDSSPYAIGKRLRFLRNMAGLKRKALADMAQVTPTSISLWEHGKASGIMTPRSMSKILEALKNTGIKSSEHWLRTGIGEDPLLLPKSDKDEKPFVIQEEQEEKLSIKLATSISEEIKLFTSLSHLAVILKIDRASFFPLLEKGDWVGGIWQPATTLKEEKICIIKLNEQLQVAYLKKRNDGNIDVCTEFTKLPAHDDNLSESFNPVFLEIIAPIIRIWR